MSHVAIIFHMCQVGMTGQHKNFLVGHTGLSLWAPAQPHGPLSLPPGSYLLRTLSCLLGFYSGCPLGPGCLLSYLSPLLTFLSWF